MKITPRTAREYANAMAALLPPGNAWRWPENGLVGDKMLLATAQELTRVDEAAQGRLDYAIDLHRPASSSWTLEDYHRVAQIALGGLTETMPRQPMVIGSTIGNRLWSENAPNEDFPVALLRIDHLIGPARIGGSIGMQLWGARGRYIMRVRYYSSVVDPIPILNTLKAFKQAHVVLWFEDVTGAGGIYVSY